ncbi:LPS assembly lipoprotein LptE [Paramagnetospirillum magneticum]|uniref:Predicted secreted protein n=1 Tax=Paramagnetospirillum magneticum (strain ATCC 700264 / AMB-1) TaxID=342108 RepID=Q2WBE3_PARM1|nr:LPS assembly lipoprotein LptE [Paramagnetospirillum magneticum]BAE48832.1 Predicted secreted protein [Paramagnetospirillum magneticum AMB-1]
MWWSRALLLFAVLVLGPVGCGFRPMYGTPSGAASGVDADLATVRIEPIKDRTGQQLRNALLQRLSPRGEAADYAYSLQIKLTETVNNLGFRKDTFATVANMSITAQVQLSKNGGGLILGDNVTTTVYFDYLGPRYASVATERDAEERTLSQLADDIRNRVALAIQRYQANPNDERYRQRSLFLDDMGGGRR